MSASQNLEAYSTGTFQHKVSISENLSFTRTEPFQGHIEGLQLQVYGAGNDEERRDFRRTSGVHDGTHRKLKSRHVQLIGIGGTIGTVLFVEIGYGLLDGGPGSLFLAFTLW